MQMANDVLVSLRRIIRAMDLHSKQLVKNTGLTTAQLLLMQAVKKDSSVTIGHLADDIHLSQATVTTILDRLQERGLLHRESSTSDKRKVHVKLTEKGLSILKNAPIPLQQNFVDQIMKMNEWEQTTLLSTLQRIAYMMDARDNEVSLNLEMGESEVVSN
jgi:DNA-binding MarR family transcriptional regulator